MRAGRVVFVVAALGACTSLDHLSDGTSSDGGADATLPPVHQFPPPPVQPPDGGDAASRCTHLHGGGMVDLGAFCIDRTEVSVQDYSEFYNAVSGDAGTLPAACQQSLSPGASANPKSFPRGDVTWCSAWAYCRWAGKHLCGKIGGGSLSNAAAGDSVTSEWYSACSNGGFTKFPYGNAYVSGRCNDRDLDAGGFVPVGTLPGCATDGGALDMTGNINEWIDACDDAPNPVCTIIGGAVNFVQPDCHPDQVQLRNFQTTDIGFRCCATP
jgi:sulfatase modifying factor 1